MAVAITSGESGASYSLVWQGVRRELLGTRMGSWCGARCSQGHARWSVC